jgi:hypothetical protein
MFNLTKGVHTVTNEILMDRLCNRWCIAEFETDCIYDELGEDFTHPRFLKAAERSHCLLVAFLTQRTTSLRHIELKLRLVCEMEDYFTDAQTRTCREITPHAVVNALRDLEMLSPLSSKNAHA